ncbi:MAG: phosphodiester glycosidase family protein [Bacteroidetes bacterium]|nr:phosphodiester glycosidase family protein [Bacteroidota bacterium]
MRLFRLFAPVCLCLLLLAGCGRRTKGEGPLRVSWTDISAEHHMPPGIELFSGEDEQAPLRVWLARVDASLPGIDVEVISSTDTDGRESVSDMVASNGACLGINGGYFLQTDDSFQHIGLLIADGRFIHGATPGIFADELRYDIRRSAIGFDRDNRITLGWVSSRSDSSFWHDQPLANAEGTPAVLPDSASGRYIDMQDAIAAGPALLKDGQVDIPVAEEVFFHTTIPDIHPRTAAGRDAEGRLLLMVVDGRQGDSRGASLEELAALLQEFDAVEALNLDGGGSSTFVVRDALLNMPAGGTYQREVVSGIVVHCSAP